jgi:hypothetical protein
MTDIIRNLDAAVGGNFISNSTNNTAGITFSSSTTDNIPLAVSRTTIGTATVGLMRFATSGASIPVMQFAGSALVSVVSIVFAASANWAGTKVIRVVNDDGTQLGWIPVLPTAVVTAGILV